MVEGLLKLFENEVHIILDSLKDKSDVALDFVKKLEKELLKLDKHV